ncbi:von Willebrand factor type A domain protein [Enhygromyxa salina]|uniref:von Willebrand factor type A domain protein n=1 Tax=Enhygromyxa salina TaxID=215803 RepID=A0A2S9YBI4_9BACT|nr:VWA domain-containing protein [Enhygromyxa salina]PRQ02459.1 von Willebrand factor type A domain protein [Enhygromyxa salina]
MSRITSLPFISLLGLVALACTTQTELPADTGVATISTTATTDTTAEDSSTTDTDAEDSSSDDAGAPCSGDEDCPSGQVCLPGSGECGPADSCLIDDDCPDGQTCEDGVCAIGGDCGGFEFSIEAVPPNLLIMLDRSGSMSGNVPDTNLNRWEVAKLAIEQVTTGFDDKIRFGLATYSACVGNGCSAGTVVVPLADQNAAAINGFLATTVGEGSNDGQNVNNDGLIEYLCDSGDPETSTGKSLQAQVGNPTLQDLERDNAILLITDGSESGDCVDNEIDGPVAAANLFGQATPVKVFAVGFGGANLSEVNDIAEAGGTEMGYLADQADELDMALDQIANAVATCTFELDQVPPDPNEIYVFFDKDPAGVPNDPNEGWTYDPMTNTVTFHGPACDAIKGGVVVDIDIVYGCNMPPIG